MVFRIARFLTGAPLGARKTWFFLSKLCFLGCVGRRAGRPCFQPRGATRGQGVVPRCALTWKVRARSGEEYREVRRDLDKDFGQRYLKGRTETLMPNQTCFAQLGRWKNEFRFCPRKSRLMKKIICTIICCYKPISFTTIKKLYFPFLHIDLLV